MNKLNEYYLYNWYLGSYGDLFLFFLQGEMTNCFSVLPYNYDNVIIDYYMIKNPWEKKHTHIMQMWPENAKWTYHQISNLCTNHHDNHSLRPKYFNKTSGITSIVY